MPAGAKRETAGKGTMGLPSPATKVTIREPGASTDRSRLLPADGTNCSPRGMKTPALIDSYR